MQYLWFWINSDDFIAQSSGEVLTQAWSRPIINIIEENTLFFSLKICVNMELKPNIFHYGDFKSSNKNVNFLKL